MIKYSDEEGFIKTKGINIIVMYVYINIRSFTIVLDLEFL